MDKFLALLMKNIKTQIKETPFHFLLINLSLSVGIFCIQFLFDFMFAESNKTFDINKISKETLFAYSAFILIVLIYTMINVIALYRFLSNESKRKYVIYKMYGCKQSTLFLLPFFEFSLYSLISTAIGTAVFYLFDDWRKSIDLVTHSQTYYFSILLYSLANIVVIFCISFNVSKLKITKKEQL